MSKTPKKPLIDRIDDHLTMASPTRLSVGTIASNLRATKERSSVGRALRTLFARGRVKRDGGTYYVERKVSGEPAAEATPAVDDGMAGTVPDNDDMTGIAPDETAPPVQEDETVSPSNGNAFVQ